MEVVVHTSLKSVSSKKSIVLKPEHRGDGKVVLVKHHLPLSGEKEKELNRADALSKTCKRKSFEMSGTEEKNELHFSGKRRRSVPLTGTIKPSVALVQDLVQHLNFSFEMGRSIYPMQQSGGDKIPSKNDYQQTAEVLHVPSIYINEGLDFQKDDQEHDELVNDLQDCNLLPNWLDNRNRESLMDPSTARRDWIKSLFSLYDLDLQHVENDTK